jgi:enamine deaminase RidA (YjgF/YER057c/UK114 family)
LAPGVCAVEYGGARWIYVSGIEADARLNAHDQATEVFQHLQLRLARVGIGFEDVVRTWLYVGGITDQDEAGLRYAGLNAARTEFFEGLAAARRDVLTLNGQAVYPASTGIGMNGRGLSASCMALQTTRPEVRRVALENPWQTPSCDYAPIYSPQSPKFSRAMAVLLGSYVTTWVSGTASIVDSASVFPGDIERQTQQTLDNIEALIAAKNFARHGLDGCGAALSDLAKVRVYVKSAADYARCRAVCQERLGGVPAIYALADVCRPELLVEIEGVAFSAVKPQSA